MKKLILALALPLFFTHASLAGTGHSHGDEAFLKTEIADHFDLTDYQIQNLQLKTELVKKHNFYETVKMSIVLRKSPDGWAAQGFMFEGNDILRIKTGQKAFVYIDVMPERTLNAKIVKIDDMLDPKTRLFSAHAEILSNVPANAQGLKGEMIVQTSFSETALGVPSSAVQGEFGNYFVFTKTGNHFERKPVVIGHSMDNITEITAGLEADETIVTQGSYQLQFVTAAASKEHDNEEIFESSKKDGHDHDHRHGGLWEKIKNLFGHKE